MKVFAEKRKLEDCVASGPTLKEQKQSSWNEQKKGSWKIWKENRMMENYGHTGNFILPLVISTLYLISEAKIITLADRAFKVCRENI